MDYKGKIETRLWLTLIFLSIVAKSVHLHSYSSDPTDAVKNGVIVKQIGRLSFYNAQYIIPMRLYKTQIVGQYEELHAQFMALYELMDQGEQSNMTDSLVDIILSELSQFKHDYFNSLSYVTNLFKWTVNSDYKPRRKRGVVNGMGELSRYLFGTGMDADVQRLNMSLSKLYENSRAQDVEINLHKKFLEISTDKISKLGIVQAKLTKLVIDLSDQLEKFNNMTQILEQNLYNSNAFSSLILALLNLNQKTLVLKSGIESMMYGELSPSIIDNESLQQLLQIIQDKGHTIVMNNQNMPLSFYYKVANVKAIIESDFSAILFLVAFPVIYDHAEVFDLKSVESLYMQSSIQNLYTRYKIPKYLALSKQGWYAEFEDLSHCQKVKSAHVCPVERSLNRDPNDSCQLRLINNIVPFEPTCNMEVSHLKQPIFKYMKEFWYYAIPTPVKLTITCKDNYWKKWVEVKNMTLQGSGKIKIIHGCVGTSVGVFLMPTSTNLYTEGKNITITEELLPTLAVERRLRSLSIIQKINISELFSNSDKTDLNELTAKLSVMHTLDNSYTIDINYFSALSYIAIILSTTSTALAIALITMMIQEYRNELHGLHNLHEGVRHYKNDSNREFMEQDLKDGLYKMPLYENDFVRRQPIEVDKHDLEESWKIVQNPIYVDMDAPVVH